jgi:hypothetical protein
MRRASTRFFLVAAALIAGIALLRPAGAADVGDDEFKALLDHDIKIINQSVQAVEKASAKEKKGIEKNAASGIKSSALMIAGYANDRISGSNATADGKSAAIRDTALKIYKAADAKDFKGAAELAKGLADAKPAAGAKKIDLAAAAKELGEVTQKEVMHNFLKTSQFGTNYEADIIANAKKATAKPADANLMAHRVLVMGEYNKFITKTNNAAEKKSWDEMNEKMIKAAQDLQAAAKKKSSAADMAKVFTVLNSTCTACHDDFK